MAGRPRPRSKRRSDMDRKALEMLGEHGYHGFSMRDIARATDQSAANAYHHVADKETLVYRALLGRLDAARASIEATYAVRTARGQLRALVTDHIRRLQQVPAEAMLWRRDVLPLHDTQRRRLDQLRDECELLFCSALDNALGGRPPRRDASLRRARLLLSMAEGAARKVMGLAPERAAREVLRLFLDGARP